MQLRTEGYKIQSQCSTGVYIYAIRTFRVGFRLDSRRLRFRMAFLEGRARRTPTGVFSRARILESRATDERSDPELGGSLLGRGDAEVSSSPVLFLFLFLLLCVIVTQT